MSAYITRTLLKERLILTPLPAPLDPDLDRLIQVASGMVRDRCITFNESAPPDPVQQVTLMLAMNLRIAETGGYTDGDGHPVQVPLWTRGMTDILGSLIADSSPEIGVGLLPASGVITKTAPLASPVGWPDANAPHLTGDPNRRHWFWGPRP